VPFVTLSGENEAKFNNKGVRLEESDEGSGSSSKLRVLGGSGPSVLDKRDSGPEKKMSSVKDSGSAPGSGSCVRDAGLELRQLRKDKQEAQ
jgi:hypothetical protein